MRRSTRDGKLLPAHDVQILVLAALFVIGAERQDVEVSMLSGVPIDVSISPGIHRDVLEQVRAVPVPDSALIDPQDLKPFRRGRLTAYIEAEQVEHGLEC